MPECYLFCAGIEFQMPVCYLFSGVARRRKVGGGGAQTFSQKSEKWKAKKKKKKKKKGHSGVKAARLGGIVDRERAYNLMHFLLKY